VAHWLLSVTVEIYDNLENCLHSNATTSVTQVQVKIIQYPPGTQSISRAKILSRSYFIPPGKLCFRLLNKDTLDNYPPVHLYAQGRCEWDNIISNTFGAAADVFLCPENAGRLGGFLCSGFGPFRTRLDLLSPSGEPLIDEGHLRLQSLLKFSARRLPELAIVLQAAENNPSLSYDSDPKRSSLSNVLAEIYPCSSCFAGIGETETMFCLYRVGTTIFQALWTLSWLDIDPVVKPMPTGLLALYYTSCFGNKGPQYMRDRFLLRGLKTSFLTPFTGSVIAEETSTLVSAISDSGVCIYSACLKNPDVDPSQRLRYRVVIGQIERNWCIYQKISDQSQETAPTEHDQSLYTILLGHSQIMRSQLVVEETLDPRIIEASFHVKTQTTRLIIRKALYMHIMICIQEQWFQRTTCLEPVLEPPRFEEKSWNELASSNALIVLLKLWAARIAMERYLHGVANIHWQH
jgi:hypothetical protein